MTFAAVTLLGMTLGQPPAPDYYPFNSRTIKIPIEYKQGRDRKAIQHVLLNVAHNGENTWYQEAFVTPDKDEFRYVAKEDGIYWFKMVIVDLKGKKDVPDMTREPPDMKILVDTVQPQVRVTTAKRNGDEIIIAWAIEDKNPDDSKTKVDFKPATDTGPYWQEVGIPANSPAAVKFRSKTNEAVTVRITAVDLAGNRTEITQDFPATGSTSLSPPNPVTTTPLAQVGTSAPTPPPPMDVVPVGSGGAFGPILPGPMPPAGPAPAGGPAPAPVGTGTVTPAAGPGPVTSPPVIQAPPTLSTPPVQQTPPAPPAPPVQQAPLYQAAPPVTQYQQPPQPYQPPVSNGSGGPTPLPTVDPKAQPAGQPANAVPTGAWTGAAPAAELPRAQIINYTRFDLNFDLEQRGPSGISRVDLWVTRNEGKSWSVWKKYDGKGGAVRVVLDTADNQQLEGSYGFRLVPVSGAGLSDNTPASGDVPDMRVVLDVTAPQIELSLPQPGGSNTPPPPPGTLVIQWQATDRNFGDDPVILEWSESQSGPWKSVAVPENDPVVQTAVNTPVVKRLPSAGQYAWRVPEGTAARVYLRATARDAAGNVREVVTRDPILVDVTKPKAKISGIVPPPISPRP